jgi:zinc transport system ATP-binding protein
MIKTEKLSFSYTGLRPFILDGIDMEIKDGEYVSIVGDNGCGKSTLIRLLLALIKPTAGSITNCAERTGYVPQKSEASMSGFPITVYEMLNSYRRLLKIKDRETVFEALKLAGLNGLSSALIGTLSGGQLQKALIARALLGSPDLLVLDEPSSGLTTTASVKFTGLSRGLTPKRGLRLYPSSTTSRGG